MWCIAPMEHEGEHEPKPKPKPKPKSKPKQPILTKRTDAYGAAMPKLTWKMGRIYGSDKVPKFQIDAFREIAPWYTHDRIERLVLPFLRRGSLKHDKEHQSYERTYLSFRTLETVFYHFAIQNNLCYNIIPYNSDRVTPINVGACYRWSLWINGRHGIDIVRRGVRVYIYDDCTGSAYPTTLKQLRGLKLAWEIGVIHYCVCNYKMICKWRKQLRRLHHQRKTTEDEDKKRSSLLAIQDKVKEPILHVSMDYDTVTFVDRNQFDIILAKRNDVTKSLDSCEKKWIDKCITRDGKKRRVEKKHVKRQMKKYDRGEFEFLCM